MDGVAVEVGRSPEFRHRLPVSRYLSMRKTPQRGRHALLWLFYVFARITGTLLEWVFMEFGGLIVPCQFLVVLHKHVAGLFDVLVSHI